MGSVKYIESKSSFGPDQWLWCLHCERFFQGRDARFDGRAFEGCAFAECGAAGYQIDIHDWDMFAGKCWPKEHELTKGLSSAPWEKHAYAEFEAALANPAKHGIGPALNQDWKRRDAILGIFTRDEPFDPTPFYGADADRLEMLLRERFAPPGSLGRYAPIEKLIGLMRQWPQLRASGFALHPSRKDYRVSVTAIECALDTVHPDLRDELLRVLETEFGADADFDDREWEGRVVLSWTDEVE